MLHVTEASGLNFALPRLLYIADTPVEASCHGSTLIHRLLSDYPADRLRIIEIGNQSDPERRLVPGDYHHCPLPVLLQRLLTTRFRPWAQWALTRFSRQALSRADDLIGEFQPEAVLTVMHGYGWMKAHDLAAKYFLPLHCVVHDDWPCMYRGPGKSFVAREFGECYRAARSRFCVSEAMVDEYALRYGCQGSVLLPSRAAGVVGVAPPPERTNPDKSLTIAFAGSVNGRGYVKTLLTLANRLAAQSGTLQIYGPLSESAANQTGLLLPNVKICGLVNSSELVETLQRNADVLFVPMSFEAEDRINMTIAFPSKLADCTLTGLPLLIYGPEYSSAVRFAKEHRGLGEVVSTTATAELDAALTRLRDPSYRRELGQSSLVIGNDHFSLSTAQKTLYQGLDEDVSMRKFVNPPAVVGRELCVDRV